MVRPVVRRDRLEAYPTLRQGVFAVGAGTCCIDASFLFPGMACRSGNPPTIVYQPGLARRVVPFQHLQPGGPGVFSNKAL